MEKFTEGLQSNDYSCSSPYKHNDGRYSANDDNTSKESTDAVESELNESSYVSIPIASESSTEEDSYVSIPVASDSSNTGNSSKVFRSDEISLQDISQDTSLTTRSGNY